MAEIRWIKITTSMFDDEKIKLIENMPEGVSVLLIWIKLLTLAGRCNATGYIFLAENIPYTEEMLATIFNMQLNIVRLALNTFANFSMIEVSETQIIKVVNWEKYQNIEGLEKIREQTRQRVADFRQKQKSLPDVTLQVTPSNATDKNRLDQNRSDKEKNKRIAFTPPTIEEVTAYCLERNKGVDPGKWHDFYQAKGWKIGKNAMRDWKAAVRTWERNDYGGQNGKTGINQSNTPINNKQSVESRRFVSRPIPFAKGTNGTSDIHEPG